MARGVGDLSSFTFLLLLMIFGFALSGMNIFGQESDEYVSAGVSFVTLFLTVLGEFDLDRMLRVDGLFGYAFFIFYQILIFLVMVNIFLAILNDAYLAIKAQYDAEGVEEGPPPPTFKERIATVRSWLRQRKLDKRIEFLRGQQRQKELVEKRNARKIEQDRERTLRLMGVNTSTKRSSANDFLDE